MNLAKSTFLKTFLKFVIPSVLSQWVYALYTMVDGAFVAKGVGEFGLTGVNLSSPILQLLFSISLLFAVGTSTVTAIFLGRNEKKHASEIFTQNVAVQIFLALFIIAVFMPNLSQIAQLLGAKDKIIEDCVIAYLSFIIPFTPFFLLSYTFEILLKTDGFPCKTAVIVIVGVVENCILDWLFVIVMEKGMCGAALATSMSQGTVTVLYLAHFLKKKGTVYFVKFKFDATLLVREIKNGTSAAITELSAGLITLIFNQAIVAFLFSDALVSYAVVSYVNSIIIFSVNGVVQGSQPLISYYYGKQMNSHYRKLLAYCLFSALALSIGGVLICWMFTDYIVAFYVSSDAAQLRVYSVDVMRIFSLSFPALSLNIVISGYLAALEHALPSIWISLGRSFVFLLLGLTVLISIMGGEGVWFAPLLSEITCLIISVLFLFFLKRFLKPQN